MCGLSSRGHSDRSSPPDLLLGLYINLLKTTGNFTHQQLYHSKILHVDYIAVMCVLWLSEQTVTFALYIINRLVFITEVESVYCAVRTECLYNIGAFRLGKVNL